jgi:hypothetical protein
MSAVAPTDIVCEVWILPNRNVASKRKLYEVDVDSPHLMHSFSTSRKSVAACRVKKKNADEKFIMRGA